MKTHPSRLPLGRAHARHPGLALGVALAGAASVTSNAAHAGGFQLVEHGASGMGVAYAGNSAVSADGSTAWFNPAGLSELDDREISLATHLLSAKTDFTNEGTTLAASLGGTDVSGPDIAEPGTTSVLPNFYYTAPVGDRFHYGLSIGVPFGSSTEYDDQWVGRYTTIESGITVIDINPSIAYRVSDTIRLGFGVSLQQLSAELSSAVDSGAVCLSVYSAAGAPEECFDAGLTPGNVDNDGGAEITGDSLGFGFNLGALFVPTDSTKIGIAYRSAVSHELEGDADFSTNASLRGLLDAAGQDALLTDTDATAEIDLPPTLSLSIAQNIGERVQLLGDITWTGWSNFEELRVTYDNQAQPDTLSLQEWEDVLRYSAGINFDMTPALQLRAGVAFDEEAIPGPERRTARIPGNDRTWLAFGAGYNVNDSFSFDVGYAHLFLETTAIDNQNLESNGGSVVRGSYESSVDIISAQINWQFN